MIQRRRGAAMVEMALVMPLLMLLLLGIIEFGMIMHDKVMLDHAVSVGARAAAMGEPLTSIRDRTVSASTLQLDPDQVQVQYRDASTSDPWTPVGDRCDNSGNVIGNNAPPKSMVQVAIQNYPHQMMTGSFFAWLPGFRKGPNGQNDTLPLSASLTTVREGS